MKRALMLAVVGLGCAPHPSPLRTTDFTGISKLALAEKSGSAAAIAAIEEELKRELPALNRFELVADPTAADATFDLAVEVWWLDEKEAGMSPSVAMAPLFHRVETMEATFHLSADGADVSQSYRRTASGTPHQMGDTMFTDDLVDADAVQVVAGFLADLKAGGAFKPSQPPPGRTAPPGEPAVPL